MDPRNIVPEFKKRKFGAVSVVLFSRDFKSVLVCKDLEKGSPGMLRYALPGGSVEEEDRDMAGERDPLGAAIRELEEEGGVKLTRANLTQIGFYKEFGNGTRKEFFVADYDEDIPLRETGTWQKINRNGEEVDMQVLGPPEWVPIEKLLVLPPRGYCAENIHYLHYMHVRGLVEAIMFLHGKGIENRHRGFARLWTKQGQQISAIRSQMSRSEAA